MAKSVFIDFQNPQGDFAHRNLNPPLTLYKNSESNRAIDHIQSFIVLSLCQRTNPKRIYYIKLRLGTFQLYFFYVPKEKFLLCNTQVLIEKNIKYPHYLQIIDLCKQLPFWFKVECSLILIHGKVFNKSRIFQDIWIKLSYFPAFIVTNAWIIRLFKLWLDGTTSLKLFAVMALLNHILQG